MEDRRDLEGLNLESRGIIRNRKEVVRVRVRVRERVQETPYYLETPKSHDLPQISYLYVYRSYPRLLKDGNVHGNGRVLLQEPPSRPEDGTTGPRRGERGRSLRESRQTVVCQRSPGQTCRVKTVGVNGQEGGDRDLIKGDRLRTEKGRKENVEPSSRGKVTVLPKTVTESGTVDGPDPVVTHIRTRTGRF